jgi:hypothetical protein
MRDNGKYHLERTGPLAGSSNEAMVVAENTLDNPAELRLDFPPLHRSNRIPDRVG